MMDQLMEALMAMPVAECDFIKEARRLIVGRMLELGLSRSMDLAAKASIPFQHAAAIMYGVSAQVVLPFSSVAKALETTIGISMSMASRKSENV